MKKRITVIFVALALVATMVFGLTACGGKNIEKADWEKLTAEAAKLHNYKIEFVNSYGDTDEGDLVAKSDYTDANGKEVKAGDLIDTVGNKVDEAVKGEVEVDVTMGMVYQRMDNLAYCSRVSVGYNDTGENDTKKNVSDSFYIEYTQNDGKDEIASVIKYTSDRKWVRTAVADLSEDERKAFEFFSPYMEFLDQCKFEDFEFGGNGFKFKGDTANSDGIKDLANLAEGSVLDFIVRFNAKSISGYDWIIRDSKGNITTSARLSEVGSTKIQLPKEVE